MSLFIEKNYPFLFSLILSCFSLILGEIFCFDFLNFYNTSLSIFSILIGFLLTVSTIINTLDNEVVDFIKKSEKYYLFINYLKKAIYSSLNTLLFVAFYVLLKESFFIIEKYINAFLIYLITYSFLCCYRFIKIFIKIIVR